MGKLIVVLKRLVKLLLRRERKQGYWGDHRYKIGQTTILGSHFSIKHILPSEDRCYVTIGERCVLDGQIVFESLRGRVTIGDRTYIGDGSILISIEGIDIGSDVMLAWGVTVYDHDGHSTEWASRKMDVENTYLERSRKLLPGSLKRWEDVLGRRIVIGDRCWIGFGTSILKGVTLGEGCIVGAGSVVTRSFPEKVVIAGNPARIVRHLNELAPAGN